MSLRMATRTRVLFSGSLVLALMAGALIFTLGLRPACAGYCLVDETTLVVLKGQVEVQRPGGSFAAVTGATVVRVGDRIRTGMDSYAVVTFFDGSTTEIESGTEIELRRLDPLPGGGVSISFYQEIGITWNRVEKLVDPRSRFETTTASATILVRGTEYRVSVEPSKRTVIEAVTDAIVVETVVEGVTFSVVVEAGFQTTVEPGQPPAPATPAPSPRFAVRIHLDGPVSPFLTDEKNRSLGFQPQVGAYVSQIPGAKYATEAGRQTLIVPDPVSSYEMVLRGLGEGGSYTVALTTLLAGQPSATRAQGLARVLASEEISGSIAPGQLLATGFEFSGGQVRNVRRPPVLTSGPPGGSQVAFSRLQLAAAQRRAVGGTEPTATAMATVLASPTPTFTPPASPTRPSVASPTATGAASPTRTRTAAPTPAPPRGTPGGPETAPTPESLTPEPSRTPTPRVSGGARPIRTPTVAPPAATAATVTPTATPEHPVRITGRLVTTAAPSTGISGVWLRVQCGGRACVQEGPTGPDGSFSVRGDRSIYTLWVASETGYTSPVAVQVDATVATAHIGIAISARRATSIVEGAVRAQSAAGPGIPGAMVALTIPVEGTSVERVSVASARTNSAGRYQIAVADGSYAALAEATGYQATDSTRVTMSGPGATLDFVLRAGRVPVAIRGRLLAAGSSSAGIPGVWLRVQCGTCAQEAPTGADGSFTIRGEHAVYTLWAASESGYTSSQAVRVDATTADTVSGIALAARRASATVIGTVRSETSAGAGIASAQVQLSIPVQESPGETVPVASAHADPAGSYRLAVSPGAYAAQAWAPGYEAMAPVTTAVSGATFTQNFVLRRPGPSVTITGRLLTTGSAPRGIAGVRLSGLCSAGLGLGVCSWSQEGATAPDGSFTVRGAYGIYALWAESESGYVSPVAARVDARSAGSITGVEVTASPATTAVVGTVRSGSRSGPALSGARVEFLIGVQGSIGESVTAASAVTNEVGAYRLSLAPGTYTATASAPGNPSEQRFSVTVSGRVVTQDFTLASSAPVTIRGRVMTARGARTPVQGVWLTVSCGCSFSQDQPTDADGAFTIRGDPGIYTLWVGWWSGYTSPSAAQVNATTASLVAGVTVTANPATAVVTGAVKEAHGVGVPGAEVRFSVPVEGSGGRVVPVALDRTDALGSYRVSLAPGSYTAVAEASGYQPAAPINVAIPEEAFTQDFALTLPASGSGRGGGANVTIAGRLVAEGASAPGIAGVSLRIQCVGAVACLQQGPTGADGSFTVTGGRGIYTMWAGSESGYTSSRAVRVDARTAASFSGVVVRATRASTEVAGTVRANSAAGPAVVNATVEFSIPVQGSPADSVPVARATTDIRGSYRLFLAPGQYTARAFFPDAPAFDPAAVSVLGTLQKLDLPVQVGTLFVRIIGRLVEAGPSQAPVAGVSLNADCSSTTGCLGFQESPTASDGSFTIRGGYGIYTLWVASAQHTSPVAVRVDPGPYIWDPEPGNRGFRIGPLTVTAAIATTQVSGAVRSSAGAGIDGAVVRFFIPVQGAASESALVGSAATSSSGMYRLGRRLAAGSYIADARGPGFSIETRRVSMSGPSFNQDFVLVPLAASPTPAATPTPTATPGSVLTPTSTAGPSTPTRTVGPAPRESPTPVPTPATPAVSPTRTLIPSASASVGGEVYRRSEALAASVLRGW